MARKKILRDYDVDSIFPDSHRATAQVDFADAYEEPMRHRPGRASAKVRLKTTKIGADGQLLEAEAFPLYDFLCRGRQGVSGKTGKYQQDLNDRNAAKLVARLLNHNFTDRDVFATFSGDGESDMDTFKAHVQKYIRRLRAYCQRKKLSELKYLYILELGEKAHWHLHLVCNIHERDAVEGLWRLPGRRQTRYLQGNEFGYTGLGIYFAKRTQNRRRWSCSRNLEEPLPRKNDGKISFRTLDKVSRNADELRTFFEKLYPQYTLLQSVVRHSPFVRGAYVYVTMRKRR